MLEKTSGTFIGFGSALTMRRADALVRDNAGKPIPRNAMELRRAAQEALTQMTEAGRQAQHGKAFWALGQMWPSAVERPIVNILSATNLKEVRAAYEHNLGIERPKETE